MLRKILFVPFVFLMTGILLLSVGACGKSKQQTAFKGQWKFTVDNYINGNSETTDVSVATDGNRFRIDDTYYIRVFDGKTLYTQFINDTLPGEVSENLLTLNESKSTTFWRNRIAFKQSGAGGSIAGRETKLFEAKNNRPEGEITAQEWIDAETGIILKSILTIYSKQIDQMVTKDTKECVSISIGSVEDNLFNKP